MLTQLNKKSLFNITKVANEFNIVSLPFPLLTTIDFYKQFFDTNNYAYNWISMARCRVNLKRTLRLINRQSWHLLENRFVTKIIDGRYLSYPNVIAIKSKIKPKINVSLSLQTDKQGRLCILIANHNELSTISSNSKK